MYALIGDTSKYPRNCQHRLCYDDQTRIDCAISALSLTEAHAPSVQEYLDVIAYTHMRT
jgi:hypothetical protein